jgi:hypothetical protein
MVFENGVKNIKAAAYNGARTVCQKNIIVNCIIQKLKNKHDSLQKY